MRGVQRMSRCFQVLGPNVVGRYIQLDPRKLNSNVRRNALTNDAHCDDQK